MIAVAEGYSNLEYDLGKGARGSRHALCRELLMELTGAEDALVVNNAAGGLLLALGALARGADAAVSRGELVEVGGGFRIPEILARSGARLMEIGSTNRTHKKDYEQAIAAGARLLLKVHRSNFQVTGFTAELAPDEVAGLARERGLASVFDLGSGLMMDLSPWGLTGEPTALQAVAAGFDVVVFSGDKLLGGPQAGILVGRRAAIEACKNDPVARAVRADKFTLAALEATLALYRDAGTARTEIPALRMLTDDAVAVRRRGAALQQGVADKATATLVEGFSEVGGGSFPGAKLATVLVALSVPGVSADALLERLRGATPPVIARIERDRVVLDPRTLLPDQTDAAVAAVRASLDG
jgi:L-seryl-tRNA(Ser) seleniumtransferase